MIQPHALVRYRSLVDQFDRFVDACTSPSERTFVVNGRRLENVAARCWIDELGARFEPVAWRERAYRFGPPLDTDAMAAYTGGLIHIQEEASMLPAMLLDARPGDTVLDLCAAPGNKTAQLSEAVGATGTVVANDANRGRLGVLRTTMDRLSMTNVHATCFDAAVFPRGDNTFDAVLADVPCSCEGTSRRHPTVLYRSDEGARSRLVDRQRRILERALRLCRPGGRVVYATCTFAPEECEGVVAHVLSSTEIGRHAALEKVDVPGLNTRPGLTSYLGAVYPKEMTRAIRLWPHLSGTDGFFVAVLRKRTAGESAHASPPGAAGASQSVSPVSLQASSVRRSRSSSDLHVLLAEDLDRFGIPAGALQSLDVLHVTGKYAAVGTAPSLPLSRHEVFAQGVRAVNVKGASARLSTAGAMLLGPHARRAVIDLSAEELQWYLMRRPVHLEPNTAAGDGPGSSLSARLAVSDMNSHALIRSRGLVFGRAEFRTEDGNLRIESRFPRVWAGVEMSNALVPNRAR